MNAAYVAGITKLFLHDIAMFSCCNNEVMVSIPNMKNWEVECCAPRTTERNE